MQDQGDGLQPLTFLSRRFKPTEQRYSAYERELAAVAYCLQSWRHYLEGCPGGVTVVTDHQPLVRIMDQQVLTRVQMQWLRLGFFQSIRPTIKYQPGKANVLADALSRSQRKLEEGPTDDMATIVAMIERHISTLSGASMELATENLQQWTKAYKEDKGHVAALAKFVANNAVNMATGYNSFFLNFGDHPLVPSVFMHGRGVLSQVEAAQMMVDRMKTALEEAQANLTVTQSRAKSQVDYSRRDETFEVGDEVVLSTRHISVN